jgi:hypothetical protein
MYENELYHHGIVGMKWGKKNGPPYPLSKEKSQKIQKKGREKKDEEYRKKREKLEKGDSKAQTEGMSLPFKKKKKIIDRLVKSENKRLDKLDKHQKVDQQQVTEDSINKVQQIIDEDRKYLNSRNYGEKDLKRLTNRFNSEADYNNALQRKLDSEMYMLNSNNKRMSRKERAKYERLMEKYERDAAYNRAVQNQIDSQINLIRSQQTLKQLTTKPKKKSLIRRGAEWTGKWATDVTKAGLYNAGTRATTLVFDELFNRGFNAYYNKSSRHKTYVPNELPNPLLNAGGGGKKNDKKNNKK